MRTPKSKNMTNAQLADLFKKLSFQQANGVDSAKIYRKLYERLKAIGEELRRRGPEARRALIPLLDCPRSEAGQLLPLACVAQCRYNAAWELLAIEPDRAHATLRALATSVTIYQMGLARETLDALENGSLKPT